jgi:ABC-type multidrug transport system fused ATPase/permease subunit
MKRLIFFSFTLFLFFSCQKNTTITPTQDLTFFQETRSCGMFVVYQYGKYKSDSITFDIRNYENFIDTSAALKTVTKTFDTGDCCAPTVNITNYQNYVPFSYCPGIIPKDYQPIPKSTWIAKTGEISMKIKQILPTVGLFPMYKMKFVLKNVVLKNEKNEVLLIDELILDDTIVGGPIPG